MQKLDAGSNVFIIDDDPIQLTLFARQLSRHGLEEARCYCDGAEALSQIASDRLEYPLLFLDLNMPELDGVEVVRKLVEMKYDGALALVSGEDVRVLDSVARLAAAHQLDVVGYFKKPVKNDALQVTIDRWKAHVSKKRLKPRRSYGAHEIQGALARKETVNFYQPKIRISDANFYGVEALVRWQHPEDGLIYPDQFISVAEEHGLIEDLTATVLVEAIEQCKRWHSQGIACSVGVNISMDNLVRLEFPSFVKSELTRHALPPECLILEITESRLTQDSTTHLDILTRLRLKQVSLSIDDFGTGHSSMAQLRDLPFNELKIDRTFVHGAASNAVQRAIVEANLALAVQLGMTVVAEGIEDRADWDFLRDRNCTCGQGYFIGKPMPAAALVHWIEEWNIRRLELLDG